MISHLSGTLFEKSTQSIIIEVGGVGYEIFVPLSTFYALPEHHEPVNLHIHTHVREDALVLFGFSTKLEKSLFLMLVSVSGIGSQVERQYPLRHGCGRTSAGHCRRRCTSAPGHSGNR